MINNLENIFWFTLKIFFRFFGFYRNFALYTKIQTRILIINIENEINNPSLLQAIKEIIIKKPGEDRRSFLGKIAFSKIQ